MSKKIRSLKAVSRLSGITASILLAVILLSVSLATQVGLASSNNDLVAKNNVSSLALQATPTPTLQVETTSTYSLSLAALGYDETTLNSPRGDAKYVFKIPEYWSIQGDGVLELDLSYLYDQIDTTNSPAQFGNLTVMLDDQTLTIFQVDKPQLNHRRLSIPLPASLLAGSNHEIRLAFDGNAACLIQDQAKLIIHSASSTISLDYNPGPLLLDLSRYPRPFYQQAFDPDRVLFVLPAALTNNDLNSALSVAAKLGDLTGDRLVISATIASDLVSPPPTTLDEHLIIVGQPQNNELLALLNKITELPVSLHQQQLELVMQGPTTVAPSDTFTYTFAVTNTLDRAVNLKLINPLPRFTKLVDCTPDCQENANERLVTWNSVALAPEKSLNLLLTLKAADTITGVLENTITLVDDDLGPLNADTLTSTVVTNSVGSELQTSGAGQKDYFFMYNGRAVAKGDGIVQQIASPWGEGRAILILTGLTDEAVRKASQAMSSETRFPGMSGPVALVQDTLPPSEFNSTTSTAVEKATLADLGYQDEIVRGEEGQIDYIFDVPSGWRLTNEAAIDLYFSHSQLTNENSALTVLVNKTPLVTVALNEETSRDGHVHVSLADANIRSGQNNRLSIQVAMVTSGGGCNTPDAKEAFWLRVKKNSVIFLAHNENPQLTFDLDNLPYPFNLRRDLMNVLLALPSAPTVNEVETALRLAARLGSFVTGKTILPVGVIGGDLPTESLPNYHIIAIGRPSRNPLIQQVNSELPQPFLAGTDEIEQRLDDVILRLPPGVSLGYLQLFPSPWNEQRAFLAITGTTDEGVQWAIQTMSGRLSGKGGNLALIKADQITTIDTRTLTSGGVAAAVATAVPEMTPVSSASAKAATPTSALSSSSPTPGASGAAAQLTTARRGLPSWVVPVVGVNGLIVLGIFAFVFWRTQHRKL
jgi:hypothetical protein